MTWPVSYNLVGQFGSIPSNSPIRNSRDIEGYLAIPNSSQNNILYIVLVYMARVARDDSWRLIEDVLPFPNLRNSNCLVGYNCEKKWIHKFPKSIRAKWKQTNNLPILFFSPLNFMPHESLCLLYSLIILFLQPSSIFELNRLKSSILLLLYCLLLKHDFHMNPITSRGSSSKSEWPVK